jgi:hypothetical protein
MAQTNDTSSQPSGEAQTFPKLSTAERRVLIEDLLQLHIELEASADLVEEAEIANEGMA